MVERKNQGLPLNEIIDRLYHRQDVETILSDFIEREIVKENEVGDAREKMERLKSSVNDFRIFSRDDQTI